MLPAWRGAAPVQHAILHGDDVTGATTFRLVAELDAGPVFGVLTEPIRPADTAGELLERLATAGARLLTDTLDGIEDGTLRAVPQPAEGVSLAPKLTPEDGRVDWKLPAHLVDRRIRGCTPEPGAWTEFDADRLKLWPVTPLQADSPAGSARGNCTSTAAWCTRAPARAPCGSATYSRRANAGCPPLTGRVACAAGRPHALASASAGAAHSARLRVRPSPAGAGRGASQARRPDLPRRTAYDVLAAVASREAYANLLLPRLLAERSITGRDAALATELSYGTLRGRGTYDAVLAACSDRPLDKLDPPVLQVLRLGAHQLLATRVGSHAAVATSVDLAKAVAGHRVSGYVNAVLRRVSTRDLDQWLAIVAPDQTSDEDGYLAVRHSYPRWIIGTYRDALGDAAGSELTAALAAGNERPRVTLATYPGGPARDEVMPDGAEPSRWSPYGFTLAGGDPSALIAAGLAAVQDEGSQLAAIALAKAPLAAAREDGTGERWLDMCAGPGGKARLLHGLAATAGARLVAADVHPHRAELIQGALAGHGTAASAVLAADGRFPPWRAAESTGCSWTCPAPASAPCAAALRHAGASPSQTCPPSPSSSARCSDRPSPPAAPVAWWPM